MHSSLATGENSFCVHAAGIYFAVGGWESRGGLVSSVRRARRS